MIALVDYGVGNLRSVEKALVAAGAEVTLTDDSAVILAADKVVLPGVGAFGDGMAGLQQRGLVEVIQKLVQEGKPLLGICLGMQLLFESSEEMGEYRGLGLLPGRVVRFPAQAGLKVPQIGWNQVLPVWISKLLYDLPGGSYAYFNHSYYCAAQPEDTLGMTEYGLPFPSVVGRGRLYGAQFHPEKSQAMGMQILRNFVEQG